MTDTDADKKAKEEEEKKAKEAAEKEASLVWEIFIPKTECTDGAWKFLSPAAALPSRYRIIDEGHQWHFKATDYFQMCVSRVALPL